MRLHCLYVFNKHDECMHYIEWVRPRQPESPSDDRQVVLGLAVSADSVVSKLSQALGQKERMRTLRTDAYSMHLLSIPTGLRFVLFAEKGAPELSQHLWHIYSALYVPMVVMCSQPFSDSSLLAFEHALDSYARSVIASEPAVT